jgi:FixJ family two-component response regulator
MKLLFVEDDDDKAGKITSDLAIRHPEIKIFRARSFTSGLECLVRSGVEISGVILDMSMPSYDNSSEAPEHFAGRDLLQQCKMRRIFKPTVVVTMLDRFGSGGAQLTLEQLDKQLMEKFSPNYLGVVYFSSVNDLWKNELSQFIKQMEEWKS